MSNDKDNTGSSAHNEQPSPYHVPVLLNEVIDGLDVNADGVYVDCTFGGGGHSTALLQRLGPSGKLIAFDQDEEARNNLPDDSRILFIPHNFRHIQRFLRLHKFSEVDGIMADLGVSSHQFDEAERGFSTRFDGELDMRMDHRQSFTAYQVINSYNEERLHKLFELYGEVTNAKTLAKTITSIRHSVPLKTIGQFKNAISGIVKGNPNKYFAQVFQALRIEVNDEMGALKEMLEQLPAVLKPGGRVAIITFHSLEDRMVKNFFKKGKIAEEEDENPFEQKPKEEPLFRLVTKKPIVASAEELKRNPRSRSAKLRIAERV